MSRTPTQSAPERERDVRRTRNEGARRVLRARQLTDVIRDARRRDRRAGSGRTFPARERVTAFAGRVRRLARRP
jgi:hypothetical protein